MDSLRTWMVQHRFVEFLPAFTDVLGVECVDDLPLVTEADLSALGLKPIQARRFASLVAQPETAVALRPGREPHQALGDNPPVLVVSQGTAAVHSSCDGEGAAVEEDGSRHERGAPARQGSSSNKSSTLQWDHSASDDDPEWTGGSHAETEVPALKRRKTTRLSFKQRVLAGASQSKGSGRLRLPTKHSNGAPRSTSHTAAGAGLGHATPVMGPIGACRCAEVLKSFDAQFAAAKRTAHEKRRRGGTDRHQSDYNYARLGAVFVAVLFDGRGNWVVHERCAREHLHVSNWWLAKYHK